VDIKELEKILDNSNFDMDRRDAFKKLGLLGGSPLLFGATNEVKASSVKSNKKIVIVGGGAAGITVAARLTRAIDNPDITIIEPSTKHVYQAGHTLVGGGIIDAEKLIVETRDYIPEGNKWIKSKAKDIDPDNQKVTLENNKVLDYDMLVICTGFQYDWEKIEGLDASMIGKNGINSIYTLDGAKKSWENMQSFAASGGEAIFTHPNTPIKCGGAPKKVLYIMEDYLKNEGARDKANLSFIASSGKLFQVPVFEKAIEGHFKDRDINYSLKHHLVKIDSEKKEATFKTTTIKKGAWDDILEEYEEVEEDNFITKKYDFIHIAPPMSAPDFLKNSKVAWQKGTSADLGLIEVDRHTLQHKRYDNIFSLGDVAGTPIGKTGGTVRKQAPIVVENMLNVMQGKKPTAKFDGYTVCPIITRYGKVMLAEFDYDLKPTPTIPGLAVEEERWMWWVMKVHILEPMYFYGMLRGLA
jgi:sulfide:quinone oxidoreductase